MSIICGIYAIKNIVTNKIYIGQSMDVQRRWKNHKKDLISNKHANKKMQRSFNKYGSENFEFYMLEVCSLESLSLKEQKWIDSYLKSNLLNFNLQVEENNFRGKKHLASTKKYMSKIKKGKYEGKNNPNYGKLQSKETKLKMLLNRPKKLTVEDVLKIKELLLKRDLSDEEIAQLFDVSRNTITRICNGTRWFHITGGKIINSERRGFRNIGKPRSESFKNKIKAKLSGRQLSQETKDKISKSKLGKKHKKLKGD
jgi:group I intron endonuclease